MSVLDAAVPDSTSCARCGAGIRADSDGEYRRRYRLEDAGASSYGDREGKLCFACWDAVQAFIEGGNER